MDLLSKLEDGARLSRPEAETVMEELLSGRMDTPAIVRLLLSLNLRPLTAHELSGFARIMRKHAAPVFAPGDPKPANLVDTCGTGGDSSGTFNISTAAAIVAAAAGARVAKHGNRSVSSLCGSADVLEALGVHIDLPLHEAGRSIRDVGIGFLFAPAAHSATRYAVPARKQIGKRTVFNFLGPLTNPAAADSQVLGVFSPDVLTLVAETLAELGITRAFVLHGGGGLDELSLSGETQIVEVRGPSITYFTVSPADFGLHPAPFEALRGGTPVENAALLRKILQGQPGPPHDIVVMNAAAALVVTGIAESFLEGAGIADRAISSGAALAKLQQLIQFTNARKHQSSNPER